MNRKMRNVFIPIPPRENIGKIKLRNMPDLLLICVNCYRLVAVVIVLYKPNFGISTIRSASISYLFEDFLTIMTVLVIERNPDNPTSFIFIFPIKYEGS